MVLSFSVPPPSTHYTGEFPVASHLIAFELDLRYVYDVSSLGRILQCMPNLRRFTVTVAATYMLYQYISRVLDGSYWRDVLSRSSPTLLKFDFLICLHVWDDPVDLDEIVQSFDYFPTRFNGWHMAATQWLVSPVNDGRATSGPSILLPESRSFRSPSSFENTQLCG